jgi:hypothetical protein
MTTRKSTKGQTTIYKKTKNKTKTKQSKTTQIREVNIEEDEPHKKPSHAIISFLCYANYQGYFPFS